MRPTRNDRSLRGTRERGPAAHETPPQHLVTAATKQPDNLESSGSDRRPDVDDLRDLHRQDGWALVIPDVPQYGSREYLKLPEDDSRRQAAQIRAAWSWWAAQRDLGAPTSAERLEQIVAAELTASRNLSKLAGLLLVDGVDSPGRPTIWRALGDARSEEAEPDDP